MDQNIRLGKIRGIPIGANWSVLVIFLLVAWELSDLILPTYHPNAATATYWVVGVATTLLFFASLLAHEASHALVARRNGVGVRRITLWLFGGVSELESDALTPGADFRIAIMGPLVSFVLSGAFALLTVVLHSSGYGVVVSALGWLAWMNLMLGVFNLVPGAPLDGGRVLRSILWQRSGDRVRAATSAAHAGQVVGYILVALGLWEILVLGIFGLWFVFLGWFLLSAARSEESSVVMRSSLSNVHARDIMTSDPVTFAATTTVADLLESHLHQHRFGTYPLVDADGQFVGLTTIARIRQVPPDRRAQTQLIDVAEPRASVPMARPNEALPDVLQRMQLSPDGRALILDDAGQLVGIISPSDVARYVQLNMIRSQGLVKRRS
ncbi:MAG TPA: site-2 protease family protein [Acidimicrobiales bacterium]|nr:site-2 protease family protein [Acidimicrobiales bacterium]